MPLGAGSVVGTNIVLERPLGSGAMGTVWLAQNKALSSQVAVKVLNERVEADDRARARFRNEAKAIAQLDSPHVIRVFDYGVSDEDEPYFVMELLRGRDLKQEIEARGALPLDDVALIVKQTCRGLRQAHEAGLIHRDLKPANVFLLKSDEVFVKILDFGIVKQMDATDMGLTETGALVGTPYYMSPEQFVAPKSIDHRSDIWSLAVVAYAAVCGKLPFLGATVGALSMAVHKGDFEAPDSVKPDLPGGLARFFRRAFQVLPEARFSSVSEMAAAFERACKDAPDPSQSLPTREMGTRKMKKPAPPAAPAVTAAAPTEKMSADEIAAPTLAETAAGASLDATQVSSETPRRTWLIGAGVVTAGALGWLAWPVPTVDETVAPAASTITAEPSLHKVSVAIEPPGAEVRVDGRKRNSAGGSVVLEGRAGTTFAVEARHEGRNVEATVVIGNDGSASHERLVVPRPRTETSSNTEPSSSTAPPTPAPHAAPPSQSKKVAEQKRGAPDSAAEPKGSAPKGSPPKGSAPKDSGPQDNGPKPREGWK